MSDEEKRQSGDGRPADELPAEELAAEVERLTKERDELQAEVEAAHEPSRPRWRSVVAMILVAIAVLSLAAATPAAWARRTVTDTDRYIATITPLASDPAIQEALAREITTAIFDELDVQARISDLIAERAPRLAFVAGPLTNGLQGFVQDQVQKLVESEAFQTFWIEANRVVHEQVMTVLEGGGDVVSTEEGVVTLNYLPLVNDALASLSDLLSDLLNRQITLPEITPDTVPSEAIAKIEAATGLDLPETFGSVVIYQSDQLAGAQQAFETVNRTIILTVVLFFLATAGALLVSTRRRRTLLQLMTAFAVLLVIERRTAIAGGNAVVDQAKPENQAAARAIVDTLLDSLLRYTGWLLLISVVVALIALITGPYPWAVRVRGGVADLWRGIAGMEGAGREGTTVAWVGAHRDAMMLGGAVVAVLVLWLANLSGWWLLLFAILVAVYELLVWRAGQAHQATAASEAAQEAAAEG